MKIIHPLKHPELYKAYGKTIGGGILMYGPPGCGKTHLARATAGEVKAGFLAVGINDVLDMWIGESEKNLHELFEQARRNTPVRAVLRRGRRPRRQPRRHAAQRRAGTLINQFLVGARRRRAVERGRADPRGHQRAVAPRLGVPPARPVRPHPVRAAARRRRAGGDPAAPCCRGKPADGRRLRRRWRRRPTASPAPT